jgi:hypothetical protein
VAVFFTRRWLARYAYVLCVRTQYAAGETCVHIAESGASLVTRSRTGRIAPVSREVILNYVAQNTLGLPKSY